MPGKRRVEAYFSYSEPTHIDGTCERCHNPALVEFILHLTTTDGVVDYGRIHFCEDCDLDV